MYKVPTYSLVFTAFFIKIIWEFGKWLVELLYLIYKLQSIYETFI